MSSYQYTLWLAYTIRLMSTINVHSCLVFYGHYSDECVINFLHTVTNMSVCIGKKYKLSLTATCKICVLGTNQDFYWILAAV